MKRLLPLIAMALLNQAHAATPFMQPWHQPQIFTLELQQQKQPLNTDWTLRSQSLQAELAYLDSTRLHVAMLANKTFEQLQGTQNRDLDGFQAGLRIRAISPAWRQWQLAASSSYRWHQSSRGEDSLRRHLWQLQLAMQWRPIPEFGFYGGVGAWQQQGTLRFNGKDYTLPNQDQPYRFAGLDLQIEPGGHVGIELQSGEIQGFGLYFQRRY